MRLIALALQSLPAMLGHEQTQDPTPDGVARVPKSEMQNG